jgi:hypothetical protein
MATQSQIDFYLNSKTNVIQYETLEITHPNFSQTYRIVRNNRLGADLSIDGVNLVHFDYIPFKLERTTTDATMTQSMKVTLGDLGVIIHNEISNLIANNGYLTRPSVTVRAYRSDQPMAPIFGPYSLIALDITVTRDGAAFEIQPERLANKRTGMVYDLNTYPGLRGYL